MYGCHDYRSVSLELERRRGMAEQRRLARSRKVEPEVAAAPSVRAATRPATRAQLASPHGGTGPALHDRAA